VKALCWYGKKDVRVETVPDPKILNPHDAILRVTSTAICGSDIHLYNGLIPTMEKGDILGHEFMGEIVEVGSAVKNTRVGDRVVIPFMGTTGEVTFRPSPDDRGTILHVTMEVAAPGGKVGEVVAKLFGDDPRKQIHEDLRHFKQVMEAGEIPTVDGQPRGAGKHSSETDRLEHEKNPETSILTDIAHKALH